MAGVERREGKEEGSPSCEILIGLSGGGQLTSSLGPIKRVRRRGHRVQAGGWKPREETELGVESRAPCLGSHLS